MFVVKNCELLPELVRRVSSIEGCTVPRRKNRLDFSYDASDSAGFVGLGLNGIGI